MKIMEVIRDILINLCSANYKKQGTTWQSSFALLVSKTLQVLNEGNFLPRDL